MHHVLHDIRKLIGDPLPNIFGTGLVVLDHHQYYIVYINLILFGPVWSDTCSCLKPKELFEQVYLSQALID